MARVPRPSAFLIRFLAAAVTVPALLAVAFLLYYDQVRAKSFYYRLVDTELMTVLAGGSMHWTGDSLYLGLPRRDTFLFSANFRRRSYMEATFRMEDASGEVLARGLPFDSLSTPLRRWLRKVPELGLREMIPEGDRLTFRIGRNAWLHYAGGGMKPGLDSSLAAKDIQVRDFVDGWYAVY